MRYVTRARRLASSAGRPAGGVLPYASKNDVTELRTVLDAAARYKYVRPTKAADLMWDGS